MGKKKKRGHSNPKPPDSRASVESDVSDTQPTSPTTPVANPVNITQATNVQIGHANAIICKGKERPKSTGFSEGACTSEMDKDARDVHELSLSGPRQGKLHFKQQENDHLPSCWNTTFDHVTPDSNEVLSPVTNPAEWPLLQQTFATHKRKPKVTSNITMNISANIVQIGDDNTVMCVPEAESISAETQLGHETAQTKETNIDRQSHQTVTTDTVVNKVNVVEINAISDASKQKQIQQFREAVQKFKKGRYLLLTDKLNDIPDIYSLALVNWLAVFDLDQDSWSSGLLSTLSDKISQSIHSLTWLDNMSIKSESLSWIGMAGFSDRADTMIEKEFKTWRKRIKDGYLQHLQEIKHFAEQYTTVTGIVLWPDNHSSSKHMKFLVQELIDTLALSVPGDKASPPRAEDTVHPRVVIVTDQNSHESKEIENLLADNDEIKVIRLGFDDVCRIIQTDCTPIQSAKHYQLPTGDRTNNPGLTDKDANSLKEELDVLFFNDTSGIQYTSEELRKEEEIFYKGGTLPWSWWYEIGPGKVDITRDIYEPIVEAIRSNHISVYRSGMIRLCHNPGSGGTTLAQRILWDFRKDVPCVQIKSSIGGAVSDIQDVCDKIKLLSDKTGLPVIALVDGEDETRIDHIYKYLKDHMCIIILHVKRCWEQLTKEDSKSQFLLRKNVTKKEGRHLEFQCLKECSEKEQIMNVKGLAGDVEAGKRRTIFEFGLAVHSYKYRGIQSFVTGYLRLDSNKSLQPWQTAIAYLSLVYFYGQSAIPCMFFTKMLNSKWHILTCDDFPEEMQELIVPAEQDMRMVRICHYFVAKEVLNQILEFPLRCDDDVSPKLSTGALKRLGEFSVQFIKKAGQNDSGNSSRISIIMRRTFINRYRHGQGSRGAIFEKKRSSIAPILEHASDKPPYTERFDIMKQLTDSFPKEAHFKAHLGRLLSLFKPEQFEEARMCFEQALTMCQTSVSEELMPYSQRLNLMHIYHMYGNMLLSTVAVFTGRDIGDKPNCDVNVSAFLETVKTILPNVKKACELFTKCRDVAPLRHDDSCGYTGELKIRLMFCKFVHFKSGSKSILEYMEKTPKTEASECVMDCCVVLDELFVEVKSAFGNELISKEVSHFQRWSALLFKPDTTSEALKEENNFKLRRLAIAKIKIKYQTLDTYRAIERIANPNELKYIVHEYEKNLDEFGPTMRSGISVRTVDTDYKEWICAIRHPLTDRVYRVEQILQRVNTWYSMTKSRDALYYLLVLKSIYAFEITENGAYTPLLKEALDLRDRLKNLKHPNKPRHPWEWLGGFADHYNMRRLKSTTGRTCKSLSAQISSRTIRENDFEIVKGSICRPNKNPHNGYIELDLGRKNRLSVKVYFVPIRTDEKLQGERNSNVRVEFVLGFSMIHGYEAYNVRLLQHTNCSSCKNKVEKTSVDIEVNCPKCNATTQVRV